MARGIAFAATAAVIGALAWMGVAYVTHYEYDMLAFVVGAAIGVATLFGFDRVVGYPPMITALACTALAIVGGKYFTIELLWDQYQGQTVWEEEAQRAADDEEYAITYMAEVVIREYSFLGKPLNYPLLADLDFPESGADYPTDVWNEAVKRWQSMNELEQQAFLESQIETNKTYFASISDDLKQEAFRESLDNDALVLIAIAGCVAAGITRVAPKGQEEDQAAGHDLL